jgi:glycosyltransferase involved in cell wall biosynthesis
MRLAFILSSLRLSGGVQVVVEYANRLTHRDHQVTLVAPSGTLDPEVDVSLAPRVAVRQSQLRLGTSMNSVEMARLAWSLASAVPPSDVVLSTHTPTTAPCFLATRILKRGRPVWLYQDYHEMFVSRTYESWLLRHAMRWHDMALVVSRYCQQELHSYSPGNVVVVGEGLSHPELLRPLPREARARGQGPKTILYLGDMRPRKGLSDFLQAAALVYEHLDNICLVIVSKEACEIQSHVPLKYIQRPTRPDLAQLYATCDLFVSASWREGFGLPPLEAMACGAPVVLTDSGGVREYAQSGINCLMVQVRDIPALAEAMMQVLTDGVLAERLRRNGPPTAAQFTWDNAVDRFEQALSMLPASREDRKGLAACP